MTGAVRGDPLNGPHPHEGGVGRHGGLPPAVAGHPRSVFFLFSSRLGCLGSLLVSALLTLILLIAFDVL